MKVNPRTRSDSVAETVPEGKPGEIPEGIIIIFGAGVRPDGRPSATLHHRVDAAVALGRRLERPLFIPTGAKGRHGEAEAVVMARLLRESDVDNRQILPEETATDTLSSVRIVARMLR